MEEISVIINMTQHKASQEQIEAGVIDLPANEREQLSKLLTFDSLPSREEIIARAAAIAELAAQNGLGGDDGDDPIAVAAMIGGAPYLMAALELALMAVYIEPVYAFSVRESVETTQPDGTVLKTAVFRHAGFVK
jgi:hypothetical protein